MATNEVPTVSNNVYIERPVIRAQEIRMSERQAKLNEALAKAQGLIELAPKQANNPHYDSDYADLAAIRQAVRIPLSSNGIAYVQFPVTKGKQVTVTTRLAHADEWMECDLTADAAGTGPQAIGAVITYLRRYGLSAMTGVAAGDDDAEASEGRSERNGESRPPVRRTTEEAQADGLPPPTDDELRSMIDKATSEKELLRFYGMVGKLPSGHPLRARYGERRRELANGAVIQ